VNLSAWSSNVSGDIITSSAAGGDVTISGTYFQTAVAQDASLTIDTSASNGTITLPVLTEYCGWCGGAPSDLILTAVNGTINMGYYGNNGTQNGLKVTSANILNISGWILIGDIGTVGDPDSGVSLTASTINFSGSAIRTDLGGATTAAPVTINGALVLGNNITIDTDASAADANVTINGSINADNASANNRTLTVTTGTGTATFGSSIGTTQALADLDVTAATINLNGPIVRVDDQGGNTATFTGAVVLGNNVSFDTNGASDNNLTFTSTVNGTGSTRNLTADAGTGTVTFSGAVGGTNLINNLSVTTGSALSLPAVTLTGNLNATANGAITDSGALAVTGTTTLAAGAGNNITLNTATNNFTGAVSITSGNDVTLVDANAIDLGASTVSGDLSVTASGAITDSGALAVTGTTTLAAGAGNNITLNTAGNDFTGAVSITNGNDVTLVDTNAITLGAATASGDYSVTSGGDIALNGNITASGNTVALTAVGDIDGAGIVTANTATLNAATAGLTTQPEMEVTTLNLTFTGIVGGWSGNLLSNPPPLTQGAVTVVATGIVCVNGWCWNQPATTTTADTSSYSNSYLSLIDPFDEQLCAGGGEEDQAGSADCYASPLVIEEEEDILDVPEAESIEELSLLY
jgi:hypothetical protein